MQSPAAQSVVDWGAQGLGIYTWWIQLEPLTTWSQPGNGGAFICKGVERRRDTGKAKREVVVGEIQELLSKVRA